MNIGIDIDGTITARPSYFRRLSRRIRAEGGRVHIVSARGPDAIVYEQTQRELFLFGIEYDELYLIPGMGSEIQDAPEGLDEDEKYLWQKVAYCLAHDIELFYDDNDIVIGLFRRYGGNVDVQQILPHQREEYGMKIDQISRIRAIGNMLQYYHSDLRYIRYFQAFKKGDITPKDYLQKWPGSFRSFINEFRVARNIEKEKTDTMLAMTMNWITGSHADDVDGFAKNLMQGGCTHGKQMTSLASKVLFLNDPWRIIPLDMWNKRALGVETNRYQDFLVALQSQQIDCTLDHEKEYLNEMEREFEGEINNMMMIRANRFKDKLLWYAGQQIGNGKPEEYHGEGV